MKNIMPPEYQRQYTILRLYSFIWWGGFSLITIFRPLYIVINMDLWVLFFNGALESIIVLFIQNKWASIVDKKGNIILYICIGNMVLGLVSFLIIFMDNIPILILVTILLRGSPSPDVFVTTISYRMSERNLDDFDNKTDKKAYQISVFSRFRKYGSLGWAVVAPFGGWIVLELGFIINFSIAGLIFLFLTFYVYFLFDPNICDDPKHTCIDQDNPLEDNSISLRENFKIIMSNKRFSILMWSLFLFAIAQVITYQSQGIVYGEMVDNNYILIALAYSISAFLEWPLMNYIGNKIKDVDWEDILSFTLISMGIRHLFIALIINFDSGIVWVYILQAFRGMIFGLRLPSTTYGIYETLEKDQMNLGQSFQRALMILGGFIGNIGGIIIVFMFEGDHNKIFIIIYSLAVILSIMSGLILNFKMKKLKTPMTKQI